MKFLLVSNCRCGGTNLIRTLGRHPEIETRGEKLLSYWQAKQIPEPFEEWLLQSFDDCDGWHLQRYQLPCNDHWQYVARYPIIDLRRLDLLGQYRSWRRAMDTGQWEQQTQVDYVDNWSIAEAAERSREWESQCLRTDCLLSKANRLLVTFEAMCEDFDRVFGTITRFLGVSDVQIPPVMQRPK